MHYFLQQHFFLPLGSRQQAQILFRLGVQQNRWTWSELPTPQQQRPFYSIFHFRIIKKQIKINNWDRQICTHPNENGINTLVNEPAANHSNVSCNTICNIQASSRRMSLDVSDDVTSCESLSFTTLVCIQNQHVTPQRGYTCSLTHSRKVSQEFEFNTATAASNTVVPRNKYSAKTMFSNSHLEPHAKPFSSNQTTSVEQNSVEGKGLVRGSSSHLPHHVKIAVPLSQCRENNPNSNSSSPYDKYHCFSRRLHDPQSALQVLSLKHKDSA